MLGGRGAEVRHSRRHLDQGADRRRDRAAHARPRQSVAAAGSSLGSGGMIVIAEGTCMVRLLQVMLRFYHHESCGQCTPCREGMGWLHRIIDRIVAGEGRPEDIDRLYAISEAGTTARRSAAWATPPATPPSASSTSSATSSSTASTTGRSLHGDRSKPREMPSMLRSSSTAQPIEAERRPDRDAGGAAPTASTSRTSAGTRRCRSPATAASAWSRSKATAAGCEIACNMPVSRRHARAHRLRPGAGAPQGDACSSSRSTTRSTAASATRRASARCRTTTTSTTARRRSRATPRCARPSSTRCPSASCSTTSAASCARAACASRARSRSRTRSASQQRGDALAGARRRGPARSTPIRTPTTSSTSARSARCCRGRSCYKARVWYLRADALGLPGLRARLHASTSGTARPSGSCNALDPAKNARIERVTPLENPAVNGPWICNKGRDLAQIFERPRADARDA